MIFSDKSTGLLTLEKLLPLILTFFPAALLHSPCLAALGLIETINKDDICRAKVILMTSAGCDVFLI